MPFETVWEPQGVCQKFWGTVTSPELLDALTSIQRNPRIGSLRYVLRDFLGVELFDAGLKAMMEGRAFSILAHKKNPDVVVAMVTTNCQIVQSITMASSYGLDVYPIRIFSSVSEARQWVEAMRSSTGPRGQ